MDQAQEATEKDAREAADVIETASATTSPDNASGPGAYVLFAIVALLLLGLVSGLSSCAGALADVAYRDGRYGGTSWVLETDSSPYGLTEDDILPYLLDELGYDTHHDRDFHSQWRPTL
ncbi:hypothetical protein [Olsenella sp. An293]|uniref:hypothetical protein n=1 Tax=Olsenella sp. An293 TaxID=1965626 RepID=UPI000B3AD741|nr:hypothetical protein [Olsenella sp. An293]OUO32752.1 hypothetical protein B5F85_05655 [Olsenella sp. An293]